MRITRQTVTAEFLAEVVEMVLRVRRTFMEAKSHTVRLPTVSPETSVRWQARGALACQRKPIGAEELLALVALVTNWQTHSRVA